MCDSRIQHFNRHDHNHSQMNIAQNYNTSHKSLYSDHDQEVVHFRPNNNQEPMASDDSGVCSPPLWKNTSSSPSQALLGQQILRSLSPNSRAQAIVRGQRELMEMVKNMPESSYELSLKDLVEHSRMESQPVLDQRLPQQRGVMRVKRQESKKNDKNMMRNGSFETKGLFLNMFLPFSLKSNKKNKKDFGSSNSSSGKVSPKPDVVKGSGERDWWKKKFTGSSDGESSKTSIYSGSGGSTKSDGARRKKNGLLRDCWPFLESRSSKSI